MYKVMPLSIIHKVMPVSIIHNVQGDACKHHT